MRVGKPERGVWVARLTLRDFRNYRDARLESDGRPVVLCGPNGAGKTNLLEALSLLSPGRGMRRAKPGDIARQGGPGGWSAALRLREGDLTHDIGIGYEGAEGENERRVVRLNKAKASARQIRELVSLQWLTPSMDRLFTEGKGERRRFLDRLVYGGDADHGRRVSSFENVMRERNLLLRGGSPDAVWLNALEVRMAGDAVAVAAARNHMISKLNIALAEGIGSFPKAHLAVEGILEQALETTPAIEVEENYQARLRQHRPLDTAAGRALEGPHLSDLLVTSMATGRAARQCSTGEQKALLIAILLAETRLETAQRGAPPLLLLDEVTAHLDEERRAALFDEICAMGSQAWLTGTEPSFFEALGGRARFCTIEAGQVKIEERLN